MPTVVRPARRRISASPPKARAASRSAARYPKATTRAQKAAPEVPAGWAELAGKATAAATRKREAQPGFVDAVPTLRFAVLLLAVCVGLTLYVGHLYASQSLADEVQLLQREKLRSALQHNRLRGEFDRMTAPAVILHRADGLGLRASGDYAPTILVD